MQPFDLHSDEFLALISAIILTHVSKDPALPASIKTAVKTANDLIQEIEKSHTGR
jgi:hypothetical protein